MQLKPSSVLVVINPVAGPQVQRVFDRDRLEGALSRAGFEPSWHQTTPERGADRIIEENPGPDPVLVIGGDGTVQEAARALTGGERPLAIIPRGSGNIFAQRLGLSPRLEPAITLLRRGLVRKMDVGSLGGEPFLLGVGIGLDARIVREADRRLKKQVGALAYVVGAAKTLPVRHHDFEIDIDGRTVHERGASVMVANFGTRIGPFIFPAGADGRDGLLDVAVLKAETLEQSISLLAAPLFPGDLADRGVKVYRAHNVRVRCDALHPVQVDGEDQGDHREIVCSVREQSLPVIVPAID